MKRMFNSSFVIVLVLAMFLSACSSNNTSNDDHTGNQDEGSSSNVQLSEPGTYPIVEDKLHVSVLASQRPLVEDYRTNAFTKWLEDKTNIVVDWDVAPSDTNVDKVKEKLNLTLAGGSYPDVFMNMKITEAQLQIYGQQGVFLQLDKYIDKYMPNLKAIMDKDPKIREVVTANDGHIYSLPDINECFHCNFQQKMWVYKPWLDKLGLDIPTTTEGFYEMLKAFKENDPNGNGKADEIPLSGSPNAWNSEVDGFLMNAFIYNDTINGDLIKHLYMNNGTVSAAFMQPEWKNGLTYLNKLMNEGLINTEAFVQDQNQLKQIGNNAGDVILGAVPGGAVSVFANLSSEDKRWLGYVTIPPLKGPEGAQFVDVLNSKGISGGKFVVSSTAKNPEAIMQWADSFYDDEVMMYATFGIEGKDWEKADADALSITGGPAKFERLAPSVMQNDHWNQLNPAYRSNEFRLSESASNPTENTEVILYQGTLGYEPYENDEIGVPPLILNEEQSSEILDIQKTISDYVSSSTVRFITGDLDLNKDWDAYLKTLKDMNVEKYLDILQQAYEERYSQ